MTCPGCGAGVEMSGVGRPRVYCSARCATRARVQRFRNGNAGAPCNGKAGTVTVTPDNPVTVMPAGPVVLAQRGVVSARSRVLSTYDPDEPEYGE